VATLIQSLDRGLAILQIVARAQRPVSLKELTDEIGIDASSVYRLANTLRLRGFLMPAPGGKSYVLGSAVWSIAGLTSWKTALASIARQDVVRLAAETGETSHLAVREGACAVFVASELSRHAIGVRACSGEQVPLHCTSVGKALIIHHDESELVWLFGGAALPKHTDKTVTSVAELAAECQRGRRRGYAVDDEENVKGVRCVAAPIRDSGGHVVASIGLSGPVSRFSLRALRGAAQIVIRTADDISEKLGYGKGDDEC
jgi:DNA-binding IclR family transcriptional regulator